MPDAAAVIEPADEHHRGAILSILRKSGLFKDFEIDVALEVLDVYLYQDGQQDYQVFIASVEGAVAGYVCLGLNAVTRGAFELYWIAVDPNRQRKGVGRTLMQAAEEEALARGGRLMAVETSSREDYGPTRSFYRRLGYGEEARIRDYYAPGDDKIIFVKRFPPGKGH
jgi:ribosomal protein S18 acetylase RimI-like enzyme